MPQTVLSSNLPSLGDLSKLCFPVRTPPAYAHLKSFYDAFDWAKRGKEIHAGSKSQTLVHILKKGNILLKSPRHKESDGFFTQQPSSALPRGLNVLLPIVAAVHGYPGTDCLFCCSKASVPLASPTVAQRALGFWTCSAGHFTVWMRVSFCVFLSDQ